MNNQWKSVAFWVFLATSVAFAMRIAVRAPHSIDPRIITAIVVALFLSSIHAGRYLARGTSAALWLLSATGIGTALTLSYLIGSSNAIDAWLLFVMAANAGRALECNACAVDLSLDVQK